MFMFFREIERQRKLSKRFHEMANETVKIGKEVEQLYEDVRKFAQEVKELRELREDRAAQISYACTIFCLRCVRICAQALLKKLVQSTPANNHLTYTPSLPTNRR